jgi:hypothetical protein
MDTRYVLLFLGAIAQKSGMFSEFCHMDYRGGNGDIASCNKDMKSRAQITCIFNYRRF